MDEKTRYTDMEYGAGFSHASNSDASFGASEG